jgi:hypothetical protein
MAGDLEDIAENTDFDDGEGERETGILDADEEETFGDDELSEQDEIAEDEVPEGGTEEEPDQDPVIDLGDEQVPLSELREGRLRQQDYSRKMEEVAQERKYAQQAHERYTQGSTFVNSLLQNLTRYLEGVIPAEPSLALARENPSEYQYQQALRQGALNEIAQVVEMSKQAQNGAQQVSQDQIAQIAQQHRAALEKDFPHLKGNPAKYDAFVVNARKSGAQFGFTEQEMAGITDNRILAAMHYAGLGRRSVENRNNAKRRIQAPKKGNSRPATGSGGNKQAMQRLTQTGSLRDALEIDFE